MFSRKNRFSFKGKIPRKIFFNPNFSIRYEKSSGDFKIAVVVGKKVDTRAVVRNRIKRMIVRILKPILPNDLKYTIIIYAKKPLAQMDEKDLKLNLQQSLSALKII